MTRILARKNLLIWGIFVFFILFSFLLYYPAFRMGFVGDDISLMRNYSILADPFASSNFRPVFAFFFYLINISRANSFWPHLALILFHGLNAGLVFVLINKLTAKRLLSLLVAFGFLIFYRQVEAVYYLSQSETFSTTFFLVAFLSVAAFFDSQKSLYYLGGLFSFLVAILIHPILIFVLPPIIFFYERLFIKNFKFSWPKLLKYLPFVLIGLVYFILILSSGELKLPTHQPGPLRQFGQNFSTMFLAFWPIKYDRYFIVQNIFWSYVITIMALLGSLTVIFSRKIDKLIRFFVFWAILPIFLFSFISGPLGPADRYLYLGSIGFLFVIFYLLHKYFLKRKTTFKLILIVILYLDWFSFSYLLSQIKAQEWLISGAKVQKITADLKLLYPQLPTNIKHIYTIGFPMGVFFQDNPYDLLDVLYGGPFSSYQNVQDLEIVQKLAMIPPGEKTEGVYVFYYQNEQVLDYSNRYPQIKKLLLTRFTP